MHNKDWKAGVIYKLKTTPNNQWILLAKGPDMSGEYIYTYGGGSLPQFYTRSSFENRDDYQPASPEDAYWLIRCIAAGKLVDREPPQPIINHDYNLF